MTTTPPLGVLTYASPDVRTSPPRTALRMTFTALKWTPHRAQDTTGR